MNRREPRETGTVAIDPAQLKYCPCGHQIHGEGYFVCKACFLTAPAYFRIKLTKPNQSQFQRDQARNQIMLHASRRAKKAHRPV